MPRPRSFSTFGVFVREGLLDAATLESIRRAFDQDAGEPAEVASGGQGWSVDTEARRVWEVPLQPALHHALIARVEEIRPAIETWFEQRLDPCDGLAALRYPPGAYYRPHRDVGLHPIDDAIDRRAVSIVIFLNDGAGPDAAFGGGCLRLYELWPDSGLEEVGVDMTPEAGTLVAFASSRLHEVTPVTFGERRSLVTWLLAARPA